MRYIINKSNDPYFNLALDEYVLKHLDIDDDIFFLWQNEPSIIIGKYQNAYEEINPEFVEKNNIKVARRVSGGGAVYHDLGNLNFTFISNVTDMSDVNFKKYVQPIIDALAEMGIKAIASGRNDILVNDLKISGNAQRVSNGRLMHHGTILYDVNLEDMVQALNVLPDKFISKSVKSVRSRVTNIKEHLNDSSDINDFWDKLHYYLAQDDKEIVLSDEDIRKIQHEADSRFSTWEWIYGESPKFDLKNSKRFSGGKLEVLMNVDKSYIVDIKFRGDFLGISDVSEIEEKLINTKFDKLEIKKVLSEFDITQYFGLISIDEILSVIFE